MSDQRRASCSDRAVRFPHQVDHGTPDVLVALASPLTKFGPRVEDWCARKTSGVSAQSVSGAEMP